MKIDNDEKTMCTINKVKQASDVINSIAELNFSKPQISYINIFASFAKRTHDFIDSILKPFEYEYSKSIFLDEIIDSSVSIYFLLRDIIENIEIIFYMLAEKEKFLDKELNYTEKYKEIIRMLRSDEKTKGYRIYKNDVNSKSKLEKILFKKYNEHILEADFCKIKDIKQECNNYIHKNGLKYIYPIYDTYLRFMISRFNDLLFVCKFYFKLLFLLEGYLIASTNDYIDALVCGEIPEEGSQYWVPKVFSDYINNQFSEEEKQWLKTHNQYCMQIE